MALADAVSTTIHVAFAGLWTGSVLFVTLAVLPLARDGSINARPLESLAGTLRTVSRTSALLLFLTGGHMAGTAYTVERLTGTTRGYLVLAMLALWFVLAALVEIGTARLTDGTEADKVRAPAADATPFLQAAALVAVGLLLDAGALAGNLA